VIDVEKYVAVILLISLPGVLGGLGLLALDTIESALGAKHIASITVYAPPSLAKPLEEFVALFESRYSVKVNVVVGATGYLVSRLEAARDGDLLITADHVYMELAVKRELVDSSTIKPLSVVVPAVLISRRSNVELKSSRDLVQLAKMGVRIGIPDPEVAPMGRLAVKVLENLGIYNHIRDRLLVFSDVGVTWRNLVSGAIDVAILPHVVWFSSPYDASILWLEPELLKDATTCILAGVTRFTRSRDLAKLFIRELATYIDEQDPSRTGLVTSVGELASISRADYATLKVPGVCRGGYG
jgi:molybdate transport system substrate-binding protein